MSGIKFTNTNTNNNNNYGNLTLRKLNIGDTFRFLRGNNDSVYMKVGDERQDRVNGYCLFEDNCLDTYVSLGTGQVYRPSNPNTRVERVSVHAETVVCTC